MTTVEPTSMSETLKSQAIVLGGLVALMWVVFFATVATGGALLGFGIIPRSLIGLRGILFAPFLHGSFAHLLANSIPFAMMGWFVMLRDSRHFLRVTAAAMLGSGLVAWLLGATGSVHVGASGLIFGYLGFLMFSGWYTRSIPSIVISLLVTVMWGGLIFGVLPGQMGISWQAHLGGFIGGALAARSYRVTRPAAAF
jgi:membrane associated rhomboid family serine protease